MLYASERSARFSYKVYKYCRLSSFMDLRIEVIKRFAKRGRILDVGCHDGTLHNDLIRRYSRINVWGLDKKIKRQTNRLLRGDAEQMPKKFSNFFDTIIAGELIEHSETPEKFVRECKRVLKPSGIVIVTTPNVKSLVNRIFKNYQHSGHKNLFYEKILKNIFENNGFEVIYFTYLPYTEYSSPGKSAEFGHFKSLIKNKSRIFTHYLLPNRLRENMVLVAKPKESHKNPYNHFKT